MHTSGEAPKRRLQRIPKRPLTEAVFDQLLTRILSGAVLPGAALPPERQLCLELGVSRTAVREAMARLAQLRLVQLRQGGETRVQDFRIRGGLDLLPHFVRLPDIPITADVLGAGIEMRAALAPEIARSTASHAPALAAAELTPITAAMAEDADDLTALQARSLAFWHVVVRHSGNLAYQLAFNSLRDAFLDLGTIVAAARGAELRDLAGYRAIARAIGNRDGDAAARATRTHLALSAAALRALTVKRKRSS